MLSKGIVLARLIFFDFLTGSTPMTELLYCDETQNVNIKPGLSFFAQYLLACLHIKVGHLLLELGFDPHSIRRFRHLANKITKQNSIESFDLNSD